MSVEVANFIGQLAPANPSSTDGVGEGDNHIRLIKAVLQETFPGLTFSIAFNSTTKVVLEATTLAAMRTAMGVPGLADANVFTESQTIRTTDASSGVGPSWGLDRNSASPEALDLLGQFYFAGRNSVAGSVTYADMIAMIVSKTATTESGALALRTMLAGTFATRFVLGGGLYSLNATDGDKGVDTINAKHFYKDGVEIGVNGSFLSVAAAYSAAVGESGSIFGFTSSADFHLPTAVGNRGVQFDVRSASTSVTVTIDPAGAETLDGLATRKVTNTTVKVISDGTNWQTLQGLYFYEVSAQTVTFSTNLTLAHLLGKQPDGFAVYLVNVSTEAGYSAGEEVLMLGTQSANPSGINLIADATNIIINQSSAIYVLDKSTHAFVAITAAKWQWHVKAWAR